MSDVESNLANFREPPQTESPSNAVAVESVAWLRVYPPANRREA